MRGRDSAAPHAKKITPLQFHSGFSNLANADEVFCIKKIKKPEYSINI